MTLPRRALLAAPLILAAPLLLAAEPVAAAPVLLARADGLVALTWVGRGAVLLPGAARPLGMLALAGVTLVALAVPADARLTLLALCGRADGARPRLLGLEVLDWHGADGAHLETRFASAGDGVRIRLARQAAAPRDRLRWRREAWTDYLAWRGAGLADAPVRPPPPGTWQARLGGLRARVQDWLATPRDTLTPDVLAGVGGRAAGGELPVG
mgnify:CR=1 FL=1